jgi:hypothetical protein
MESPMQPGENMLALKNNYIALALGLVACSGASAPPPTSTEDNSVKVPPFSDTVDPTPPPAKEETPAPEKSAASQEPAKPSTPAPPPECPTEAEPNNDADTATEFTNCITGELTSWTDTDYLKLTAPKDVTDMIIDHIEPEGVIQYTVTTPQSGGTGGSSNFNMSFTDKAPVTKIKPGQVYVFALKWDNNGAGKVTDKRTYAIRVSFQ